MSAPVVCSTSSGHAPQLESGICNNKLESGESNAGGEGGTSSTCGAAFNIFCAVVGTGMLQQAYGAAQTGWVGAGVMLAMGILACYTAVILIRCVGLAREVQAARQGACKEGQARAPETYGDIGQAAFGLPGRVFIEVQMHVSLVMVATVYNLLGGLNLMDIVGSSVEWLTPEVSIALVALAMWFHVFLKSLGEVAAVSAINTVITLGLAGVIVVQALSHPPAEPPRTVVVNLEPMELGGGFATFIFAYSVHSVLPTVYSTMRRPEQYESMIKATFVAVVSVTFPMLCVGYAVYGEAVQSPIYNTPALAGSSLLRVMVALITVHLLGAYAIVLNPTERALETALKVDEQRMAWLWRMCLRTLFVLFTYGVSVLCRDSFPPLLELVSSFTSAPTMFLCPCAFYIKLSHELGRPLSRPILVWNFLVMIVSVVGSVFGVVGAVTKILSSW